METFNVSKMATVSNAAIAHLRDVQAIENWKRILISFMIYLTLKKYSKSPKEHCLIGEPKAIFR